MNDQAQLFIGSVIRHGLTAAAGYLGATAFINGSWMDAAVAFGVATVGLVWSFLQKRYFANLLSTQPA